MYSIVVPYLSSNKEIKRFFYYLKINSLYNHEIIEIVDETDVYYAFNKGIFQAKYDTVVLISSDMIVSKHWDKFIPIYSNQKTILTGYVVEQSPGSMLEGPSCIEYDCGDYENFDYEKFQNYVDKQQTSDVIPRNLGWYQPLVVNKKSFVTYPNIQKFPYAANDSTLILDIMPKLGFEFSKINMWVYHTHKNNNENNKKRCIFTYNNFQVDDAVVKYQKLVIDKINNIPNCFFEYLKYNAPDGIVYPDAVIDYAFNVLFNELKYDTILMLDIDCIPLNTNALKYMFTIAEKDIMIGNIQRSNHIENNKHTYIAPSAICISKNYYEKLGKPSFSPNTKGDVGESLTYKAEELNMPFEMLMPSKYDTLPFQRSEPWPLSDDMLSYGIGTTFVNNKNDEMFYHLFQSSMNLHTNLFINKCIQVLTEQNL
jgi:hypothetical protein